MRKHFITQIHQRLLLKARYVRVEHESRVYPTRSCTPRFSLWEQNGGNRREIDSITSAARGGGPIVIRSISHKPSHGSASRRPASPP